jgi:hypothetical protein
MVWQSDSECSTAFGIHLTFGLSASILSGGCSFFHKDILVWRRQGAMKREFRSIRKLPRNCNPDPAHQAGGC